MAVSKLIADLEGIANQVTDGVRYARIKKYQFDILTYTVLLDTRTVDLLRKRTVAEYRKISDSDMRALLKKEIPYLSRIKV